MQRDYWYSTARDWRELDDVASVGRLSGERAVRRLGARKLGTMRAPVLFSPEVARGLIGHFIGAIRGGSQYRRASFLLDAAGQRLFPDWFSISERPHLAKALASAPFDHEGVATRDRELVEEGVLLGYVLGTYSARKLGLRTHRQCGRNPQSHRAWPRRRLRRDAAAHGSGSAGHRADGAGREWRDRRLFARRGGILGRGRQDPVSGARSDRRRQPEEMSTAASSRSATTWTFAGAFARVRSWSAR